MKGYPFRRFSLKAGGTGNQPLPFAKRLRHWQQKWRLVLRITPWLMDKPIPLWSACRSATALGRVRSLNARGDARATQSGSKTTCTPNWGVG
jgi:hypothetical protein